MVVFLPKCNVEHANENEKEESVFVHFSIKLQGKKKAAIDAAFNCE
jgi:hypothetical protein